MMNETRFWPAEMRIDTSGSTLVGYSVVYDRASKDLGGFIEIVRPGALTRTLKERPDVFAFFNHHADQVLGRTTAGTLRLSDTAKGLHTTIVLPQSPLGENVKASVGRGDITGMSFSFRTKQDKWISGGAMGLVRELLDVDLFEVSVATVPAYPDTSVALRSLEAWRQSSQGGGLSVETARRMLAAAMDFPTPYEKQLRRLRQRLVNATLDAAPKFDPIRLRQLGRLIRGKT